jgi:hypothetical protein
MHILHAKERKMNTDLRLGASVLNRGQLRRLDDSRGTLVQCLSGTLWLTQEGDARDLILEAGDEFCIERDGLSVVSALSACSFVLLLDGASASLPWRGRAATASANY